MKLIIDCEAVWLDRDGTTGPFGNQGLDVRFENGLVVHFTDEEAALRLAISICNRLGVDTFAHEKTPSDSSDGVSSDATA